MPPKKDDKVNDSGAKKVVEGQQTAVAVLHAPRLPYSEIIQRDFDIDRHGWRALVEAHYPNATTLDSIVLVLSYCKSRGLDPFKKPVHIVPMYSSALRRMVDTVWPGIAEIRTTATRSKIYAGCDAAVWGPMKSEEFSGKVEYWDNGSKREKEVTYTVEYPEWCQITLYKIIAGVRCAFVGPKTKWKENYATQSRFSDLPNEMWKDRPESQLEKCAEAAALRRAFPEDIGNQMTAEEMEGKVIDVVPANSTIAAIKAEDGPPDPKGVKKDGEVVDADFTEVEDDGPPEPGKTGAQQRDESPLDDDTNPSEDTGKEPRIEPHTLGTDHPTEAGKKKTVVMWVDEMLAGIATSESTSDVMRWGDLNRTMLEWAKGNEKAKLGYDEINALIGKLMKSLPSGAEHEAAKKKAAPKKKDDPTSSGKPAKDDAKPKGGPKAGAIEKKSIIPESDDDLPNKGEPPENPDEWLGWVKEMLDAWPKLEGLDEFWRDRIAQSYGEQMPPDQTAAIKLMDKREAVLKAEAE